MSLSVSTRGQAASFDLGGPGLRISVKRDGVTLPIAQVPNLSTGDELLIKAHLPEDQSARYLLVVTFLRGATNPPPKEWFFRVETWKRKNSDIKITVPKGAQQAIAFLAPETGGGFGALVKTVRGRPGAFVRASQDLYQASLDRSRLDAFLDGINGIDPAGPNRLAATSPVLARSLAIKLSADCLQRQPAQQAACLTQGRDSLVLHDGRGSSLAQSLMGAPTDLAYRVSAMPQGGSGYYSPYIGLVRDLARVLGAFRSAEYQYIPALAVNRGDRVALLLNTAPSFLRPQSVMVTALPPIEPSQPPNVRLAAPDAAFCSGTPGLVLPIEGAPLIYSTGYARDMLLRVEGKDGRMIDLSVIADAGKGGFAVAAQDAGLEGLGDVVEASLRGYWGFDSFKGPPFKLQNAQRQSWRILGDASLVVGRDNTLELRGKAAACVESVKLRQLSGTMQPIAWKATHPDTLALTLPLGHARSGDMRLEVKQHGVQLAASLTLRAYAEASRIDGFTLHAGDRSGVLKGARLDQVAALSMDGLRFQPGALIRAGKTDELGLASVASPVAGTIAAGQVKTAKVALKDGRVTNLKVTIAQSRPIATLISKSIEHAPLVSTLGIRLTGEDALPQGAKLTFSVRAEGGTFFKGREEIELATGDGTASIMITPADGLNLENDRVAVATIDLGKALPSSTFGPLRFRIVQQGLTGDWQPLATLVRVPVVTELACQTPQEPCTLAGSSLFLIDAVSDNAGFNGAVKVPQGYSDANLKVPHPINGQLYLRLKDDPQVLAKISV